MVFQFAPQISPFDAVGNEIFALRKLLSDLGVESQIICERADRSLQSEVHRWSEKTARSSRLTLLHYSHGSAAHENIIASAEPKVLFYHNVTPARFFRGTHPNLVRASEMGRQQLARLAGKFDSSIVHSRFSAVQLQALGFRNIRVLPYVSLPLLHEVVPDAEVLQNCRDGEWINILSVAQVSPHKCIEDSILVFDYFKRFLFPNSRLIIVGGWAGTEAYLRRLQRLVSKLKLRDVVFTGQVSMEALAAYYQSADIFLCMSEHEGFCVPLVEAMRFDIPIFAYNSTAIPETLRGSGVLFQEKDWPAIAEAMAMVIDDRDCRTEIVTTQRERMACYRWDAVVEKFREFFLGIGLLSPRVASAGR